MTRPTRFRMTGCLPATPSEPVSTHRPPAVNPLRARGWVKKAVARKAGRLVPTATNAL